MTGQKTKSGGGSRDGRSGFLRILWFPLLMAFVYVAAALTSPEQAMVALRASIRVFLQIIPALVVAFVVMTFLNLLVTPAHVKRFLGRGMEVKGVLLSAAAGILSMGSIYAWYPLLKDLREKGVSDFHLANFLGCRAVKIPLMPMMAAYFGWTFTLVLSILMVLGAMVTGLAVSGLGQGGAED